MTNNKSCKWLDACIVYILLWLLGYIQIENLIISNNLIPLIFYFIYIATTFYYVFRVFSYSRPKGTMAILCVFFALLFCYAVALLIMDNARGQDRKSFLMMLLTSLGPIFAFYEFTKQGLLTPKRMRWLFVLFLLIAIKTYFESRTRAVELAFENRTNYEEIVNNTAYSFAGLLSFVFLFKKKPVWQYLLIAFLLYFVVSGMKRGAMLSGALILIWFVYVSVKTVSKRKKWGYMLLTIAALSAGYYYIDQYYENNDFFQKRVEETTQGASNRDVIYGKLWHHFINNDNILQVVLGEGAYHTENVTGTAKAHNDWLELLIDCGLLGVCVYLIYWLYFIHDWRRSRRHPLVYSMLGACFLFAFSRTFFSMSFSDMPFYLNMILGFSLANADSCFIPLQNTIEYD